MTTIPVTIPLPSPVKDAERTLESVTIGRRRNGADLRAEAAAGSTDAMKQVQIARLCGVMPGTVKRFTTRFIDRVAREIVALTDEPPEIAAWPYKLAHPVDGLTHVASPREAFGADALKVGTVAGDNVMMRMIVWVELLCGLTPAQFDSLDAVDAEALCLGVVPFYSDSPTPGNAGGSTPALP